MPVPDPMTPIKSENIEMRPIIIPPHAAATGIYLLRTVNIILSGYPLIIMLSFLSFLAMSLGDYFDI